VIPVQVISSKRSKSVRESPSCPADVELHRAVLAEVRGGSRVVLVGEDATLAQKLEQAGCTVYPLSLRALETGRAEEPSTGTVREQLSAFSADLVVFMEGWAELSHPEQLLREVVAAAPRADVALPFYNIASATHLVASLTGVDMPYGLQEEQVLRWVTACGLKVRQRQVLQTAQLEGYLARDTEKALRGLFQQLNPRASAHRLLYWSRHAAVGEGTAPRELVPGLLTVVIRNHSLARMELLDQTLFSLACQDYQPLEIILSSQCRDPNTVEVLTKLLEKYRGLGGYTFQVLHQPTDADIRARLINKGIEAARGQYLAFLDDDDVVYPQHYAELIKALQEGHQAWAVARTRRAFFTTGPQGELYCRHKDEMMRGDTLDLGHLIYENFITCHAYVLDRSRLGKFPVGFAEELSLHEDYVFLLRLCALFRPALPPGVASCEYRIRDDGSNSIMYGGASEAARREKQRKWALSSAMKDAYKRGLQMLLTEQEFQDEIAVSHHKGSYAFQSKLREQGFPEVRYQIVDKLNALVKHRGPRVHQAIKSLLKHVL